MPSEGERFRREEGIKSLRIVEGVLDMSVSSKSYCTSFVTKISILDYFVFTSKVIGEDLKILLSEIINLQMTAKTH